MNTVSKLTYAVWADVYCQLTPPGLEVLGQWHLHEMVTRTLQPYFHGFGARDDHFGLPTFKDESAGDQLARELFLGGCQMLGRVYPIRTYLNAPRRNMKPELVRLSKLSPQATAELQTHLWYNVILRPIILDLLSNPIASTDAMQVKLRRPLPLEYELMRHQGTSVLRGVPLSNAFYATASARPHVAA